MNNTMGVIVVAIAIVCLYLAQCKSVQKSSQRLYSLLGGFACMLVASEAARREEPGVLVLFAAAAIVSICTVAVDLLKRGKPEA